MRFRRAVIRDAAYAGLAYRTRRRLHARCRAPHGAGVRRDARRGRRHAVAALPPRRRASSRPGATRATAAVRAADRYAYAAAADLWARALDAARRLDDVPLGRACRRMGAARRGACARRRLSGAAEAFGGARRLAAGDVVREASLVQRQAHVHERSGPDRRRGARRRARGCGCSKASAAPEADARPRAARRRRSARCASARAGTREAARLCREAIAAAEAAGDELALARACFLLDWALVDLGRREEAVHSDLALAIYDARRRPRPPGGGAQQPRHVRLLGGRAGTRPSSSTSARRRPARRPATSPTPHSATATSARCSPTRATTTRPRRGCAARGASGAGREDAHGVAFATTLLGRLAARDRARRRGPRAARRRARPSCAGSASPATRRWPTRTTPRRWRSRGGATRRSRAVERAARRGGAAAPALLWRVSRGARPRQQGDDADARDARRCETALELARDGAATPTRPRCDAGARRARRASGAAELRPARAHGAAGRARRRAGQRAVTRVAVASSARADRRRRPARPEGQSDSMMPSPEPVFLRLTTHGGPALLITRTADARRRRIVELGRAAAVGQQALVLGRRVGTRARRRC